ncbi:MAG: lysoplasmalogenase [Ferruginibacter sp.]
MRKVAQNKLSVLFALLCLLDIYFSWSGWFYAHLISKALLVPVLLKLSGTGIPVPYLRLLQTGLFFSWIGDVLLLFDGRHELFFMGGLAAFLTTHIFYIIYFLRKKGSAPSLLLKQPWWILLTAGYGIALVWILFPHLGGLTLPVIVYATVICCMLLASLHAFYGAAAGARHSYWLGAFLFVLSDSLLALNKFYQPFTYAGPLIMLTYCGAQYLMVKGVLGEK